MGVTVSPSEIAARSDNPSFLVYRHHKLPSEIDVMRTCLEFALTGQMRRKTDRSAEVFWVCEAEDDWAMLGDDRFVTVLVTTMYE
jgi:hypothetical protein